MIICPKCNKELEDGTQVCDACGEVLVAPAAPEAAKPAFDIKKIAVLGIAAVAVIALVIFIGSLIFGGGTPDYALYIKDGELVFANDFKNPYELTDELADGRSNSELASIAGSLGYRTYITEDGNRLFYLDEMDENGGTLYYKNPKKAKADPVKIDSDISSYFFVNEKGTIVTYVKDGSLYQHNLKNRTKIKSDVSDFLASLDGKELVFTVTDDEGKEDLYYKNGKKDEQKIASDIENILYVNKSFSKIYYEKNDAIYLKDGAKETQKLCSDVGNVLKFYEDGSFYYTEKKEDENLLDGEEVVIPTETSDFIDQMVESLTKTLCFYNGKESKVLTAQFYGDYRTCMDEKILGFSVIDRSDISDEDYENGISIEDYVEWNIAFEETYSAIELDDTYNLRISSTGKVAYVWTVKKQEINDEDGVDEADEQPEYESTATLYKIKLSGKLEAPEQIAEDVYNGSISVTSAGNVIYYKDVKDNKGDLYVDKQKIDTDVKLSSAGYLKDIKKVLYYCDWDNEKSQGTLKIATLKGKSTKVGDDVSKYVVTPDSEILFLCDYKSNKGDLYLFSGSKAKKLDDDVVGIVSYTSYTKGIAIELGWIED